jgi:hypothetical protein
MLTTKDAFKNTFKRRRIPKKALFFFFSFFCSEGAKAVFEIVLGKMKATIGVVEVGHGADSPQCVRYRGIVGIECTQKIRSIFWFSIHCVQVSLIEAYISRVSNVIGVKNRCRHIISGQAERHVSFCSAKYIRP